MLAALACLAGVLVFFCLILRDAYDDRPLPAVKLAAGALLAAAAVALQAPYRRRRGGTWESLVFFWLAVGRAVPAAPGRSVGIGAALTAALTVYVSAIDRLAVAERTDHLRLRALLWPGATWVWCWLWRTIRDAHDSQEAKARLAVSEERLRFARDLHDLLGHSLSVITLKSELSAKLATKDAAKAAIEMSEVRRLAAESLVEVQVAVDGYRSLDLDEELAGVRAALEAAGARCTIEARADDLSPPARTLLAWAVREGATNVLKHSPATRCSIIDRRRGAGDAQRRRARAGRRRGQRPARARRAYGHRGRLVLGAPTPRRGSSCCGPRCRHEEGQQLDKVRWLIVYSSDLANLLALLGVFDLYLRWQTGFPAPVAACRRSRPARTGWPPARSGSRSGAGPGPPLMLAVSGVIALLLTVFLIIWAMPVWLAMLAPFVRRRTLLLLPSPRSCRQPAT